MAVERLRLIFLICNLSGLFPFRMILDAQTKQFKRFDKHWRHPFNWLFLIVFFGQGLFYIMMTYSSWIISKEIQSKSTIYSVIFILGLLNYVILCFSLRLLLFRVRHLETAIEIFQGIDRLLAKKLFETPCRTKQRTIIGLVFSVICVIYHFFN